VPRAPHALLAAVLAVTSLASARADSAEDWVQKGRAQLEQQQFAAALQSFAAALEADPSSYAARVGVGRCRIELNEMDEAIEALEKAQELDSSRADAFLYLGIAHYYKAEALAEGGAQATVVVSLFRDARNRVQAALSRDEKSFVGHQFLGLVSIKLEEFDDAALAFKKAVELKPDDGYSLRQLGEVHYLQEMYAEAVPHFEAAIKAFPSDPASYQRLGYCHQFLEEPLKAEEVYRRAIAKIPDSQMAYDDLYRLYAGNNKFKEAIEAYRRILQADPKNAKVHWYLGYVYREAGVDDKSSEEFKKALELNPKMYAAHFQLGRIQQDAKNLDGALLSYRKALALAAEAHVPLEGDDEMVTTVWQIAGQALPAQRRMDDAIALFRDLVAAVPEDARIWSDLGLMLRDAGKYPDALQAYEKAVALLPDDGQILNDCAVVLDYHLDRLDDALPLYERGASLDNGDALFNLGRIYTKKGRYLEAIELLDRSLALDPGRQDAKRERELARQLLRKEKGAGDSGG
jgi:tetratricopeptide (TPR) repeat protein